MVKGCRGSIIALGAFANMEMSRRNRSFIRSWRSSELIEGSGNVSNTNQSRGAAMVITEQATQSRAANDSAFGIGRFVERFNELVIQTLMVSFRVIVGKIFANCVSQLRLIEKDHSVQALGFNTSHKPFDVRVEVRRTRGQEQRFGTRLFQRGPKRFGEFCVAVHQDVFFIDQKSVTSIRQVPRDLFHPCSVRRHGATGEFHASRFKVDREQEIKRDQPVSSPNLDGRKVNRGQNVPMRLEKCSPSRLSAAFRCGLDAVFAKNISNRFVGNDMAEIFQRADDAIVTPIRILPRHAEHQLLDLVADRRPTFFLAFMGMIPFSSDQLAMPAQDRFRREQRADFRQEFAAEDFGLDRQTPPLIVAKKNSLLPVMLLQNFNRREQELDLPLLLAIRPTRDRHQQQMPRPDRKLHCASPRWKAAIITRTCRRVVHDGLARDRDALLTFEGLRCVERMNQSIDRTIGSPLAMLGLGVNLFVQFRQDRNDVNPIIVANALAAFYAVICVAFARFTRDGFLRMLQGAIES